MARRRKMVFGCLVALGFVLALVATFFLASVYTIDSAVALFRKNRTVQFSGSCSLPDQRCEPSAGQLSVNGAPEEEIGTPLRMLTPGTRVRYRVYSREPNAQVHCKITSSGRLVVDSRGAKSVTCEAVIPK